MINADTVLGTARFYVGFIAVSGCIVGQLFFGMFSLVDTITGIAGLIAAVAGTRRFTRRSRLAQAAVLVCVVLSFLGIVASAFDYYMHLDIPGNSFGWFLKAPYLVALVVIAYAATSGADRWFGDATKT